MKCLPRGTSEVQIWLVPGLGVHWCSTQVQQLPRWQSNILAFHKTS